MRKTIGIMFLFMLSYGCVHRQPDVVYPTIDYFVGSAEYSKYKRIAVLPFIDAPNASQSGQIVQGLAGQSFSKFGFDVIERARLFDILNEQKLYLTGAIDDSQSLKVGKLLGAKAIVVGEVGQYTTQQRSTDTVYIPITNFTTGRTTYFPRQGQQWNENFVSVALRVIDVESGQLIYSGSGYFDRGITNPPQQIAELIVGGIIVKWLESPGVVGFKYKITPNGVMLEGVVRNSPAEKAGLQTGDRIVKINGKSISSNISPLEMSGLVWGRPNEIIILDIQRNSSILTFEIARAERRNIN